MRSPVNPIGWLRGDRRRDPSPVSAPTPRSATSTSDPLDLTGVADQRTRQILTLALGEPSRAIERIVLLARGEAVELRAGIASVLPDARVETLDPTDPVGLHVELAASGAHDLVIDATTDPEAVRADRARAVLFHVRKGGVLVVVDAGTDPADGRRGFAPLLGDAFRSALHPSSGRRVKAHAAGWGKAVASVTIRNGHLVITNGLGARAKIREEQAGPLLAIRGDRAGGVLAERPGTVVENPAEIRMSPADDAT